KGIAIDWVGFDGDYERYRTPLPTYPFDRQRYWVEAPDWYRNGLIPQHNGNGKESSQKIAEIPAEIENSLYQIEWKPDLGFHLDSVNGSNGDKEINNQISSAQNWLIFADKQGIGAKIADKLREHGFCCTLVFPGHKYQQIEPQNFILDPLNPQDFQKLFQNLPQIHRVVHLWSLDIPSPTATEDLSSKSQLSCGSTLHLVQALLGTDNEPPGLWLVTQGTQAIADYPVTGVAQSQLWGMGKAIAIEHPELNCVRLDLNPETTGDEVNILWAEIQHSLKLQDTREGGKLSLSPSRREVWREVFSEPEMSIEDQIAWRDNTRYVPRLRRYCAPETNGKSLSIKADGTYLITGGLGDLGLKVASWLVEKGAKNLVLLGRSKPQKAASSQLAEMEQLGVQVVVATASVSDLGEITTVFNDIQQNMPSLRGIIHAAGTTNDGIVENLNWDAFESVLAPKVQGAWNLHCLSADKDLDFFVVFSSLASLLGSAGHANYVAANSFLDSLAAYRHNQKLPALSINWGAWSKIGLAVRNSQIERLEKMGINASTPEEGLQVLEKLLRCQATQVGFIGINWSVFKQNTWSNPPFFKDFKQASAELSPQPENLTFRQQLAKTAVGDRREILSTHICFLVAKTLGLKSAQKLDKTARLIDCGLDSLMAIELRNDLQSSLECSLRSTLFFDHPTTSALIEYLASEVLGQEVENNQTSLTISGNKTTIIPIQPGGSKQPLFFVPGILGSIFELYPLAKCLGEVQPFYGLRYLGLEENETPLNRITDIAKHHVQTLQTIQPKGGLQIGGYSFGGKIAYEMAQQLRNLGRTVSWLGIIDVQTEVPTIEQQAANWDDAQYIVELGK
ncbi:MAG: SDR family NAD(P)-dependent oxidoreductase, partial [Rivularia sp. (in: cyanobacteria)]